MSVQDPVSTSVGRIFGKMFEQIEQCRQENSVLQDMLLARGLTKQQLRKEKNERLKRQNLAANPQKQFAKLCEAMRAFLAEYPVNRALLAKIPVSGTTQ